MYLIHTNEMTKSKNMIKMEQVPQAEYNEHLFIGLYL